MYSVPKQVVAAIMSDEQNPYAAPTAIESARPAEIALNILRVPSIGLLVLSVPCIFAVINGFVFLAIGFLRLVLRDTEILDDISGQTVPLDFVGGVLSIGYGVLNLLIAYGALSMRRGQRYKVALAAAVLASIPFFSLFIWLGIPFGIWALIVLRRPAVRAAFQS